MILEGARTPIGRFLGSFADMPAVELGDARRDARRCGAPGSRPSQIDQTIFGHARQAGNGPNTGRQVSIRAGVPEEVSAYNVNIACGSGMKAIQLGAQQIALGDAEVVLVGGMENMTRVPFLLDRMRTGYRMGDADRVRRDVSRRPARPALRAVMGETAENLVDRYDISREEQDEFALETQRKAADGAERRAAEMFPVEAPDPRARARSRSSRTSTRAPTPRWSARALCAGVPRGRQRHRRQLGRHHRRSRRDGPDGASPAPAPRAASRSRGSSA